MKYLLSLIMLLLTFSLHASIKRIVIKVNQMTCTLCIQGVLKKVQALPFVHKVDDIDLKTATVIITFKQPNHETKETILAPLQNTIKRAGFEFAGIVNIEE